MQQTNDWLDHTKRVSLPDGLTLLLHPLPECDAAGLHFCVKAGYFCETDAEVGLAHLLEHMYFKGSENYPEPGTIGTAMKALGGSINATTAYDQTNYFCEVPAENLVPAMEIMTDAFTAPLFPADELKKECEVVIEEFNRKIDSPSAYSQEQLIRLAFTSHRMKRWRIGTPEQLRSYTRDHLFEYFHRYYQPQNMIVTVTGKFDEVPVRNRIEALFSSMRNGELKKDFGPAEPQQKELRYGFHKATATQSYLHLAFHAPGVIHPDGPALEFLTFLLSGGRSGRLHRFLVEQERSASSVSCGYASYEDVGLILISAMMEADRIREAGCDLWTVLSDLMQNGIAPEEMGKVKNKLRLHQAMQTEEALALAQVLSYYEAYGGFERIKKYYEDLEQIQEAQLLDTARRYLTLENLSVLEFVNEDIQPLTPGEFRNHLGSGGKTPEAAKPPARDGGHGGPPPKLGQHPPLESGNGLGQPLQISKPQIYKRSVTYILQPDPHIPFISAGIFFSGGRNEEIPSTAGMTHLFLRTLLKGTSSFNAEQIAFRMDALGNPPRFNCYRDSCGFTFETMPDFFREMWNLLLHCLKDSLFPQKELETEKGKMIAGIRKNMDDNFVRPLQLFQQAFFGSHPYGIPELGLEESVSNMQAADLSEWRNRLISKDRMTVVAVGQFDPEAMFRQMEAALSSFPATGTPFGDLPAATRPAGLQALETRTKKQTALVLGFPAPPATGPDTHKYDVLQQILSGMGGRLFRNLRSKQSLAYSVFAGNIAGLHAGTFLTYIAGDAAKEEQALEGMWKELEELTVSPVHPEELKNAQSSLIGSYILSSQTASSRVVDYQNSSLLGRPVPFLEKYRERIQEVNASDILEAAHSTFQKEHSTIGIVRGTTERIDAEQRVTE